jgi:hypothetical protein
MGFEEAIRDLQRELAEFDLLENVDTRFGEPIHLMIMDLQSVRIRMEPDRKHHTPHVHIDYGKIYRSASYSVTKATRLAGNLSNKYDRIVIDWIKRHRECLTKLWDEMKKGNNVSGLVGEIRERD